VILASGDIVNNSSFADHLDTIEGLLTVNQVCDLFGLHHDTIYKWTRGKEIPAIRIGTAAKPLLRFDPKVLAAWVREAPYFFHGPSRFVTDWIEVQVLHRGGPRCRPPLLAKVLTLIGYDWMAAARHIAADPSLSFSIFHLMSDFTEAVKKLPIAEQRQLLADIRSGKSDDPTFVCEDAE
jgi:excisionase family DNA binding protein